jgi:hypothetical protein
VSVGPGFIFEGVFMTPVATKKHFATATALRRFTPVVLAEFLLCFPKYLGRKKVAVPAPDAAAAKNMPYEGILDACMAADIDADLNRVLFMATQLGNEEGWTLIQEEMADRHSKVGFDPTPYTHHDLPLMIWLRRKVPDQEDILEQSCARVRIHAKSSYRYSPPLRDLREKYKRPAGKVLKELRAGLAQHFTGDAEHKGVKVLDYDYEEEIWFLVRYPGQPVRPDAIGKDGEDEDVPYTPGQYDAVIYHKSFGDLRLNTVRKADHGRYRMAFGHALVGESNVFDPVTEIITLAPLKLECLHLFAMQDAGEFPRVQPIDICFTDLDVPGRRITWHAERKDLHLLHYPTGKNPKRLLPETVDTVHYAKFKYRLSAADGWHSMTVHQGTDLRFERDGDSAVIESWLRDRGFIIDVFKTKRTGHSR